MYITHVATRCWPCAVWHNMLDIAAINAHVIYKKANNCTISRKNFILMLIEELRSTFVKSRQQGYDHPAANLCDILPSRK